MTPFIITAGHLAPYCNHQRPDSRLVSSVHSYLSCWSRYSCGAERFLSHMCLDINFPNFFFRFPSSYSKPLLPVSQISRACRPSVVLIIPCLAGLLSLLLLVLHVVPLLGWYPTYFSPLRSVPSTFLPRGVYSCTPWYPIAHSSSSTSAILVRLFYI